MIARQEAELAALEAEEAAAQEEEEEEVPVEEESAVRPPLVRRRPQEIEKSDKAERKAAKKAGKKAPEPTDSYGDLRDRHWRWRDGRGDPDERELSNAATEMRNISSFRPSAAMAKPAGGSAARPTPVSGGLLPLVDARGLGKPEIFQGDINDFQDWAFILEAYMTALD